MLLDGATYDMARDPDRDGWWTAEAPAADGSRYGFLLDGDGPRPDPRGRRLPDGPDGLSAVVDLQALAPQPVPPPRQYSAVTVVCTSARPSPRIHTRSNPAATTMCNTVRFAPATSHT